MKTLRRVTPLVVFFLLATPAAADHAHRSSLDSRIERAQAREAALTDQIGALTTRIRDLERQAGDVSTRLGALEGDLALYRRRLDRINALLRLQDEQRRFLRLQYRTAMSQLSTRLVQIYEDGEPSTVEIVLGAASLNDALDRIDYANSVSGQDAQIVAEVAKGRVRVRQAQLHTVLLQRSVAASTRVVAYRTEQVRGLRDQLLSHRRSLTGSRGDSRRALAETQANEREWVAEADALRAASASVSSTISSQSAAPAAAPPSPSSGLTWPVSGPITSPFGMRWGSLHPGIDIGAGAGTPIHAAASGRVLVAGYSGGYGNLIVIDHGNGLATAYAHQSSLAAALGQEVSQGQVIGYVGSTGFSTGPHLHFEVRVSGSPVDPMGYL